MQERNVNLDIIRIASVILFAAILVSNAYCYNFKEIPTSEYAFALSINLISRIGFTCFFMVAGAILFAKQESMKKCLKRTLHYAIVLVLWSTIFYFFTTYFMKGEINLSKILKEPVDSNLWVLYLIVPAFLMMPFFQILCKHMTRGHEVALLVIGTAAVLGLYFEIGSDYELSLLGSRSYGVYYMFLGYFINKYKDNIPLKNWHLVLIFVASNALNIGWALYNSMSTGKHFTDAAPCYQPFAIISSAVFFLFLIRINAKEKKWTSTLASCSCGVFLLEILGYNFFRTQWRIIEFTPYWFVPVFVLAIVLIAFTVTYIIRKIPGGKIIT